LRRVKNQEKNIIKEYQIKSLIVIWKMGTRFTGMMIAFIYLPIKEKSYEISVETKGGIEL
jgi:hypothetical protein